MSDADSINKCIFYIEKCIKESTTEDKDGNRSSNITWILDLIETIIGVTPKGHDGNMTLAKSLSIILAAWFTRVALAKSKDKRRPKEHRQILKESRREFIKEMNRVMRMRTPAITPSMEPTEAK